MARIWDSEPRFRRRAGALALAALAFLATGAAEAQDAATKNAARELAAQAARAMAQGDYAAAQDLYGRAYELVPAPTLSLRQARALEKTGRWVEALEAYVRTTRATLDANSPQVFQDAVQQAYTELAALRPRVPKLELTLKGIDPKSESLHVTLDGKPYSSALIGVASPIDPGDHEVVADGGEERVARARFTAKESDRTRIELVLPGEPTPAAPLPPPEPEPAPHPRVVPVVPPAKATAAPASSQRTWALVACGVGVAGVGVGVVTGLMAAGEHQTAKDQCPNGRCVEGSSGAEAAESFRSLRTVSTAGYVVGVLGLGAGVTLWLTAPAGGDTMLGAYFGPRESGLRGTF